MSQKKKKTLKQRVDEFEAELVRQAMRRAKGNVAAVCLELGVSMATLYRKMPSDCRKFMKNPKYKI